MDRVIGDPLPYPVTTFHSSRSANPSHRIPSDWKSALYGSLGISSSSPATHRHDHRHHDEGGSLHVRFGSRPLTARSRATRLAVWMLAATAAVSVLLNVRLLALGAAGGAVGILRPRRFALVDSQIPESVLSTIEPSNQPLKHMVMVPGHAIWSGCDASLAARDRDWILEPMQKGGQVRTYLKHIVKGVEIAVRDPQALLVFSGGQTRSHADATEGMSYARLAKVGNLYTQFMDEDERKRRAKNPEDEFERVTTEDFALDSMENLLFSIARFKEFSGHYPERITVIGYGMKRARYQDVHRMAIRWPEDKFDYIGIDNEGDTSPDYEGERKYGLEPYRHDRYGCHGKLLAKRRKRNPFRRFHGYHSSAPELKELFEYCPLDNKLFDGPLPWDNQH
ncbi:hypothetical protein BMF94_4658 [Rhodotorula taiwanensis]|uniref:DUF218 domain-containing protein n=1 Tax=Rhodotorula taiwanensis TaxID=741276 RepID=A0A2S5B6I0_9BASI|nr:hypothetical protein BMF94_4658 [Rhodotorula taiwanensis]